MSVHAVSYIFISAGVILPFEDNFPQDSTLENDISESGKWGGDIVKKYFDFVIKRGENKKQ